MKCTDLDSLRLAGEGSIGYTFKCLGAGFWALKQTDFRKALTKIVMCVSKPVQDRYIKFQRCFFLFSLFYVHLYGLTSCNRNIKKIYTMHLHYNFDLVSTEALWYFKINDIFFIIHAIFMFIGSSFF